MEKFPILHNLVQGINTLPNGRYTSQRVFLNIPMTNMWDHGVEVNTAKNVLSVCKDLFVTNLLIYVHTCLYNLTAIRVTSRFR